MVGWLKIDVNEFDVNQKLDTVFYLIEFSGQVYDSFTNVKYKTYNKMYYLIFIINNVVLKNNIFFTVNTKATLIVTKIAYFYK
jgi:hypothetical protein